MPSSHAHRVEKLGDIQYSALMDWLRQVFVRQAFPDFVDEIAFKPGRIVPTFLDRRKIIEKEVD